MEKAVMKIRKTTVDDIDSLLQLNGQIGAFHYEQAPTVFSAPSSEERPFLLNAIQDSERLFLVCEWEKKVVGFLTATLSKNTVVPFLAKASVCRISTVVVDKAMRSRVVGKTLMAECHQWAKTNGAVEIRLEVMEFNNQAQGFYRELGFHTQSRIMAQGIG